MIVRDLQDGDWPAVWPFFSAIVAEGETYAYPEDLTPEQAHELWTAPGRARVAVVDERVVGSATMGPNRPGRGSHIATASFMVDPGARVRGVGRALGEDMLAWAREAGFGGVQFNAVVETNAPAVHLWQSLGFRVVGTVPGAYRSRAHGDVGLHVMFREL